MSESDGWEPRSSRRARELAQWGELKTRIEPLIAENNTWSLTRAQRLASEASRTNRGRTYEQPEEERQDGSPLSILGRMLSASADTFRDIVPQEVRDVAGGAINTALSGERALNAYDQYVTRPMADLGAGIARSLGADTSRADAIRANQRPLGTQVGETLERVPRVGGLLRTGFDVAAAPVTLATAGFGGAAGGALRASGRPGARIAANLIEPIAPRGVGFGGRLAAETAAGVGGVKGAEYVGRKAEEAGLGPWSQTGVSLLGGLAGGMAGAGLAAQGRAIARGGVNPARPSLAAEAGSFRINPDDVRPDTGRKFEAPAGLDEAVRNTPDARFTERGLELNLFRFQKPEQAGEYSGRGGVFYLADENSPGVRYYKQGQRASRQTDYGGTQRVDERVVLERPLVVKAATGGKGPQIAYDTIKGKGAYEEMRGRVLDAVRAPYGKRLQEWEVEERVSNILGEFGADTDLAYTIATTAKTGNQLPYAVQEAIVGAALREAGYDSMVAFTNATAKSPARIAEIFDVEMPTFPDPETTLRPIGGGAGQGGIAPPPALAQTFGIEEPAQGLTRAQEIRNTIKEALGQPLGMVVDDPIATPAFQARARWKDQIDSRATIDADEARLVVEGAKFEFDENWTLPKLADKVIPGSPTLQDVAARLPEFEPYLTPTQAQAIQRLGTILEPYSEVIRQTIGELPQRADVMPGGIYLHRGFEPDPEVRISIGGKAGGKQGFEKEAAYATMAEGVAAGKKPLAPWDSVREYVADVGKRAGDKYMSDYMKSVTDAAGNKLGLTSADRVPAPLRQRIEQLRGGMAARRQQLIGQQARGRAAEAELGRAERAAEDAGVRVVGALGRRAQLPDVTPDDLSAARQSVSSGITEARNLAREIAEHAAALKGTQNGLNAQERAIVAEANRLTETLAEADQLAVAADRLLSETRVQDLVRTPDTTVGRYLDQGMPQTEEIQARIEALRKLVTRGANGSPNTGAANMARMQEIGELQALDDIRYAMGESQQWDDNALNNLEPVLEDVSRSLEVRDDAAMRARNRNAGGQYGGEQGMDDDLDSLRARAALLFRVWDSGSLEVPVPMISGEAVDNATKTAVARAEANLKKAGGKALEREHRLLLRQADKIETQIGKLTEGAEKMAGRVDAATERGVILGDLDQGARQTLVEARRHERALLSGDRRIAMAEREIRILEQLERRAQSTVKAADTRAARAAQRSGDTAADLARMKADYEAIRGDWERTKALSRQTPSGRGAIELAELQGTDFPTVMTNAANRILQSEIPPTGRLTQLIKTTAALNNFMRGVRATADLSFTGIQGAIGLTNDPVAFGKAWSVALRSAKDPNVRAAMIQQFDADAAARGWPTSREWAMAGSHQGASSTEYTLRGGPLNALTQAPGVGVVARGVKRVAEGSNEAFGTFGDMMRLLHEQTLLQRALARGEIDQAAVARLRQGMVDPKLRAIAEHSNRITGWAPSKFLGDIGDVVQFAPRFFQSQLDLASNALTKGGLEGKLARREMLQYLGTAATFTVLANMALGNETGDWLKPFKDDSYEKNPNFMRIRFQGRDYSMFGPWDSLLTAVMAVGAGVVDSNPLGGAQYLARTKASPVVQMAWDLMTKEDFVGDPVEIGANWDFAEWLAKQMTPFSAQDFPALGKQALSGDVAGAGLGLVGDTLGIKSSDMTPNEELDAIAGRTFSGKGYWELEPYQKEAIKQQNPDVWRRSIERGSDARKRAEVVRAEYHAKQLRSDNDLLTGAVTRQQWRDQRSTRRIEQSGRLAEIYGDSDKRKGPPRNAYEKYLNLIDGAKNAETGQVDWDAVDLGIAQLSSNDQKEIEKSIGYNQTPLSREYSRLSKMYYALPSYVGYTADQGREIDALWTEVRNTSESELGRLREIRTLKEQGVDEAVLRALRKRAMGDSLKEATDRADFKKQTPVYRALSGNGKLTEADRAVIADILREAA